ncbi:MAG: phosphoribosylglycinamide formyltransferase 1 [Parcubacteria group bacterium Gr01-1014_48]|nr:MAG: phosphoribosylglycinamide formyltransferase 1 [Parcubacteria group bacterium Greene0416_14]TSC73448.1 MAG: phosphoribosylglycinamide formyltransferase 1 [Parcubacteria group bacterium Gr01-1014_48]TSD00042.1 MAG: phosphoribosylglycinamide formyltransferase 1 [Parcubacteria group bacterium Greene1014_15]TSD07400.1 MAG: phosphoribosylglycinamide formyltransferase 1 [Parcubacteria group bacterium Greene0714_4]
MSKPRVVVFASGTKTDGGSGFENLVWRMRAHFLHADIVAVVSNIKGGGVEKRARELSIPYVYFPKPRSAGEHQKIVSDLNIEYVFLSGCLWLTKGLNPAKTINIHPGPLPEFGGKGLYGMHVHSAVLEAYKHGEIKESAVCMHFVTEKYDKGPVFFRKSVPILPTDTVEDLAARVHEMEITWQPNISNLIVTGQISWDGNDPKSLKVPSWYSVDI